MKRNVFLKRLALGKYLKSSSVCRHVSKQSPVYNTGFLCPVECCHPRGSFLLYWTKGSLPEMMERRGYLWTFSLGGEKDHLRGETHHPITLLTWSSIWAQETGPHQSPVTLLLLQFPLHPPWACSSQAMLSLLSLLHHCSHHPRQRMEWKLSQSRRGWFWELVRSSSETLNTDTHSHHTHSSSLLPRVCIHTLPTPHLSSLLHKTLVERSRCFNSTRRNSLSGLFPQES